MVAIERTTANTVSARVRLAGLCLALAGIVALMGIISAESLYPATYTTHDNEISDLGATRPPDSVILQPSAHVFNWTMKVTGLFVLSAALLLRAARTFRGVTVAIALLGIGALGVGLFPGNVDPQHPLFALLTFVSGGIAAVVAARKIATPFRYVSLALGAIALGSLVAGLFATGTDAYDRFGDGGVERWIAYPVILWLVAYGGYLAATDALRESATPRPR